MMTWIVMMIGCVRNVLLLSICLFVYFTDRVIEANSLIMSFQNECVDLQRRRERSGKMSGYMRKLRSFSPGMFIHLCKSARRSSLRNRKRALQQPAKFTCQLQYCTSRWIAMETKPTEHLFRCSKKYVSMKAIYLENVLKLWKCGRFSPSWCSCSCQ